MNLAEYSAQLEYAENKFFEGKKNFDSIAAECRKRIKNTTVTNGEIANYFPYKSEMTGYKLNGTVINTPIESNYCMKYHYDDKNRIVMVEQYSVFLGRFMIVAIYFYNEDGSVEEQHQNSYDSYSVMTASNGLCDVVVSYSAVGKHEYPAVKKFNYENGVLKSVKDARSDKIYTYTFSYEKNKLTIIECSSSEGYNRVAYTTKKPNFKKIKESVYNQLKNEILQHGDFRAIGIEGFLDQSNPDFCLCFESSDSPSDLLAEWDCKMIAIPICDFHFNEEQIKKSLKMIAEILVQLRDEGVIKDKAVYFHQNQVPVIRHYSSVKSIFKKAAMDVK